MKRTFFSGYSILVSSSLLLFPFLIACKPKPADAPTGSEKPKSLETKTEKVIEAAKEKIETLEQRFVRERSEYRERFHRQHLKMVARTNELKRRAELEVEKRPQLERVIQKLERRTQVLRDRLNHLESVTAENWDEMKAPWQKKQGDEEYEDKIIEETSM